MLVCGNKYGNLLLRKFSITAFWVEFPHPDKSKAVVPSNNKCLIILLQIDCDCFPFFQVINLLLTLACSHYDLQLSCFLALNH